MPFIKMKDGSVAHIKLAKRRSPKCEFCRRMLATFECDYELARNLLGEGPTPTSGAQVADLVCRKRFGLP